MEKEEARRTREDGERWTTAGKITKTIDTAER